MSSSRKKRRMRSSTVTPEEILKEEEQAEEEALLEIAEDEPLNEEEEALLSSSDETEKELKKDYYPSTYGAKSWEEMDEMESVREKTEQLRKAAYAAEDLVYNILYAPDMTPDEKAGAIKKVADGFGERATQATKMEKEIDLDLLELEAILAKENRDIGIGEQVSDWLTKKKLTAGARKKLSDSDFALPSKRKYPIHDKAHVRNALSRAAQQIKSGDDEAKKDAKAALPKIRAAAKQFGIGQMNKELGGLLVEKDAKGDWRWVGWPSNKWKDRDGEIIRESAHEEYVEWVNKNMDASPVFASWHVPGSAREHPVDYAGYIDGFLVMSGKLEEYEAQALLEIQKEVDLGLSLGGICWFDKEETNVVNRYRSHEVSDLPLEKAANPFTEFTILTKEASMNKEEYIHKLAQFLPEDRQKAFLEKTQLKKELLDEAQVESKEVSEEQPETPASDYEEVKQRLLKELDIEGLSEFVKTAQEAIEKVPILEAAVEALSATNQELKKDQDEKLAEMIAAPAQFPWSKRPSQSDQTVLNKENEEDGELEKAVPGAYWLNEVTHTQPLTN